MQLLNAIVNNRTKNKPLVGLPRAPWRQTLRSFFFPETHRQWLVLEGDAEASRKPMHFLVGDWFEHFMLATIILNIAALAAFDPFKSRVDARKTWDFYIEASLAFVFLAEIIVRCVCLSIYRHLELFRLIDACIVVTGCGALVARFAGSKTRIYGVTAIRAIRMLRPFQMSNWPSVAIMINAVQSIVYRVKDAALLLLLFLLLFAVAGMPQFMGRFRTRCVSDVYANDTLMGLVDDHYRHQFAPSQATQKLIGAQLIQGHHPVANMTLLNATAASHLDDLKRLTIEDFVCGGLFDTELRPSIESSTRPTDSLLKERIADFIPAELACSPLQVCDNVGSNILQGYRCPFDYTCREVTNPFNGLVSFDNFGYAMLTMYTSTTMQLWYEVGYLAVDSTSMLGGWYINFFVVVTCFLIVSVVLVLVAVEFDRAKREQQQLMDEAEEVASPVSGLKVGATADDLRDVVSRGDSTRPNDAARESDALSDDSTTTIPASLGSDHLNSGVAPIRRTTPRSSAYHRLQRSIKLKVTGREWFAYVVSGVIMVQLVVLASVYDGMSEAHKSAIEAINLVMTVLFTIELIIRFLGDHPLEFIRSWNKILDLAVVVACYVDLGVDSDLSYFRVFRVFRTIDTLRLVPVLHQWVLYIVQCLTGAPIVLGLLVLVMLIFSVLSMHLFGGRFCDLDDGEAADNTRPDCLGRPRANFDTFPNALITSFQIITADDWNFVMYNAMEARGVQNGILFVLFFFTSNFVLLSLLIGTMLAADSDQSSTAKLFDMTYRKEEDEENDEDEEEEICEMTRERESQYRRQYVDAASRTGSLSHALLEENGSIAANGSVTLSGVRTQQRASEPTSSFLQRVEEALQAARNKLRPIASSTAMNMTSAVMILVSTITVAMWDPLAAPDTLHYKTVVAILLGTICFFVLEALLQMFVLGLWRTSKSYFRASKWNWADAILAVLGLAVIILRIVGIGATPMEYCFRVSAAFRPLTIVKRSQRMHLVMQSIGSAAFMMRYVILAVALMFVIYAILGVQLLAGHMKMCFPPPQNRTTTSVAINVPAVDVNQSKGLEFPHAVHKDPRSASGFSLSIEVPWAQLGATNCTLHGGEWRSDGLNFDNIFEALLSLYLTSTLEMWAEEMYRATNFPTANGSAPVTNGYQLVSIYFIVWAAFAGLFVTAVFTTVLVDAYNRQMRTARAQESVLIARERNGWLLTNRRIMRCTPSKKGEIANDESPGPSSPLARVDNMINDKRDKLRRVVASEGFKAASMLVIFLNFVFSATQHYPSSPTQDAVNTTADVVFTVLFGLEVLVKLYAEKPRVFIASQWNRLDLFVALVSTIAVALSTYFRANFGAAIRCIRILRVPRALKKHSNINELMRQFAQALMSLGPVCLVIITFMFTFATVGMMLFRRAHREAFSFHNVNHSINFDGLGHSLDLLMRLSTGGDWLPIMRSVSQKAPGCTDHLGDCGPPTPVPQMYFVIFMLFAIHILRNLLVAVMLDSFSQAANNRGMTKREAHAFFQEWSTHDPFNTMSIGAFSVLPILRAIPRTAPIGFNGLPPRKRIGKELLFIERLGIRNPRRERVKLRAIVDLLCQFSYQITPPPERVFQFDFEHVVARVSTGISEATSEAEVINDEHRGTTDRLMSGMATLGSAAHGMLGVSDSVKLNNASFFDIAASFAASIEGQQARRQGREAAALLMVNEAVRRVMHRWRSRNAESIGFSVVESIPRPRAMSDAISVESFELSDGDDTEEWLKHAHPTSLRPPLQRGHHEDVLLNAHHSSFGHGSELVEMTDVDQSASRRLSSSRHYSPLVIDSDSDDGFEATTDPNDLTDGASAILNGSFLDHREVLRGSFSSRRVNSMKLTQSELEDI